MNYTREQAQRDLHPHKAAVFAMHHWHDRYAAQRLGSMGFWDSLSEREQDFALRAAAAIDAADPV